MRADRIGVAAYRLGRARLQRAASSVSQKVIVPLMVRKEFLCAMIGLGLASAAPHAAQGGIWFEVGDAGQNGIGVAQVIVGSGNLSLIQGEIIVGNDADVYQILITDFANFSAQTVGPLDTMLFLFNADGTGQVANDDFPGLGVLSKITSQGVFSNGVYYIGVSRFFNRPQDSTNTDIFGATTWPGPDAGQLQANPAAGAFENWTGSAGAGGGYQIMLTGASFVPAPGAMPLLAIAAMSGMRRRRD